MYNGPMSVGTVNNQIKLKQKWEEKYLQSQRVPTEWPKKLGQN